MFDPWHQPLDVRALIRQGAFLEGELRVAQMPRLQGVILSDTPIRFGLSFGRDGDDRAVVTGWVRGTIELTCQRCLKAVAIELDAEVALGVVFGEEEAKHLPAELEPLLLGEEPLRLSDLVEDEILLALPVVALHAHACVPAHREHEGVEKADNPFAALRGRIKTSAH